MANQSDESPKKPIPKETLNKLLSLAGPSFDDVLAALLKTPPLPKEHKETTTPKKVRKKKSTNTDKKETGD